MKNNMLWKKIVNFWDYYKVHVLVVLIAALVIGYSVADASQYQAPDLQITLVNVPPAVQGRIQDAAAAFSGLTGEDCYVAVESVSLSLDAVQNEMAYATRSQLLVRVAVGELDILVADTSAFSYFAGQGYFTDLGSVLTGAQIAQLGEALVYAEIETDSGTESVPVGVTEEDATVVYGICCTSQHQPLSAECLWQLIG